MFSIKAVLLDFGGTLDANGIHWLDRIYPMYRSFGVQVSREAFEKAFYYSDDHLAKRYKLSSLNLEETLTLQVQDVLKFLELQDPSMAKKIVEVFVAAARKYLRKNEILLKELRSQYRLGVVSNFYGNMPSILKGEGLLDLFDVVADSTQVGAVKPDPKIFHYALSSLGLAADQALMVGDSLERDMRGAEAAGMPHAWLYGDRFEQKLPDPCCQNVVVLKSLGEILDVCRNHCGR
ncbi:MAG: HAD family hydrolase [Elusimicrobia bacterium]|nr:HAD family hydrolase [Elusimicrobiota bacterium]